MRIDWKPGLRKLGGCIAACCLLVRAVVGQELPVDIDPSWKLLSEVAKSHGAEHILLEEGEKEGQLEAVLFTGERAVFSGERAQFLLDGIKIDLPRKVAQHPETHEILIDPLWWGSYVGPLLQQKPLLSREKPVVFLDPGHGGKQPGAVNHELQLFEKALNLDVALRLQKQMEEAGWKVILSRGGDEELSLTARSDLANRSGAEIFISLHFNSALNPEARGIETYALVPAVEPLSGNGQDAENLQLAWRLQKSLVDAMRWKDRGVRRARFMVLRDLRIPGVLVELGFLSNQEEALLIQKEETRQQLADALWQGLQGLPRR